MVYLQSSVPPKHHMNMSKLSKKRPISACEQSPSAVIDLIILVVVICASGFLMYPYVTVLLLETVEIIEPIMYMVELEVVVASMIYTLLGVLGITTMIVLVTTFCKRSSKCGQPGCRGLRKAVEFNMWIESEDCVKNLNYMKDMKKGLFELPKDYYRELEAELKKVAPANGRVVVVFRATCGCPVVRVEVYGSKKNTRKVKK